MTEGEIVIDACCLLNLLATGQEVEVVRAVNCRLVVPEPAREEAIYVEGPKNEDGSPSRVAVSLAPLDDAGLIVAGAAETASSDALVTASEYLDDSDAACVAIAATRVKPLATDDRKIRRVSAELFPDVELISTLEILRAASDRLRLSPAEVREMLSALRARGRFVAPRADPLAAWFWEMLRGA